MSPIERKSLDSIVDDLIIEATNDYVGLWEVVNRARDSGASTQDDAQTIVREIVKMMLQRGLKAGDLGADGRFRPWSTSNIATTLEKIDARWQALADEPGIGDVCWFSHVG